MILQANKLAKKLNGNSFLNVTLIMDCGASGRLSPFKADFVDYQNSNVKLKTAAHTNTVKGIGTLMWKFTTNRGRTIFIPQIGYHMPQASVRLFSTQAHLKQFCVRGEIDGRKFTLHLPDSDTVDFDIDPN